MKSLTIHNIEEPLLALLKDTASKRGKSMNQAVKEMLEHEVGMKIKKESPHRSEFEDLCGVWGAEDYNGFKEAIRDFETINKADWK